MSEDTLTTLKIIIIGSVSVGKTSLLKQLVKKEFVENMNRPTISPETYLKKYQYSGKTVMLALWDTAGLEKHRSLPPSLFRGAQGAVLVYDVTNYKSFKDLQLWMSDVEELCDGFEKPPVVTVLGNKIDEDQREVTRQEGLSFAKKYRTLFLETSAKTNEGVEAAFDDLISKIMETPGLWKANEQSKWQAKFDVITLNQNSLNQDRWYNNCLQC